MKVDIWSDFACPFCYAGIKRFEEVLEKLGKSKDVEVNYRSLQLNPHIGNENNVSLVEQLASSYKKTEDEALEMVKKSVDFVESEGLAYDYKKQVVTNTLNAHRLVYYAKSYNKEAAMKDRIFKAYFAEGINIGKVEALMDLAEEIGLDKDKVGDVLNSKAYLDDIEKDTDEANALNIDIVPTFIFDDHLKVAGIIDEESFNSIFEK